MLGQVMLFSRFFVLWSLSVDYRYRQYNYYYCCSLVVTLRYNDFEPDSRAVQQTVRTVTLLFCEFTVYRHPAPRDPFFC